MIQKFKVLENDLVTVAYNFDMKAVIIHDKKEENTMLFSGYDLKPAFDDLFTTFSEEMDCRFLAGYFQPNIKPLIG